MAESDSTVVTLPEVHVMYLQSPNGIVGAMEVWHAFVDRLPAPVEQWAFYGTYLHAKNEYRACAAIPPGDDFEALGLATFTIPGGRYASAVLKDWEQHIPEIGTTFERLSKEYTADPARPTIEQYRDGPDVLLCLPIVSEEARSPWSVSRILLLCPRSQPWSARRATSLPRRDVSGAAGRG